MDRAIFLDRDGVVIHSNLVRGIPTPPRSIQECRIIADVDIALSMLKALNFKLIVVTNQPDIARRTTSMKNVQEINQYLLSKLPIDAFYICPHDDSDECICRKPKPGLILEAAEDFSIDVSRSYLVGDRWRDIEAGQAAGCSCYFIDYKYTEKSPKLPFTRVSSLLEVAKKITEGDIHAKD